MATCGADGRQLCMNERYTTLNYNPNSTSGGAMNSSNCGRGGERTVEEVDPAEPASPVGERHHAFAADEEALFRMGRVKLLVGVELSERVVVVGKSEDESLNQLSTAVGDDRRILAEVIERAADRALACGTEVADYWRDLFRGSLGIQRSVDKEISAMQLPLTLDANKQRVEMLKSVSLGISNVFPYALVPAE